MARAFPPAPRPTRIGADDLLSAAPPRHGGAAVGGEEHAAAFARAHQRVVHARAEVIGVAHTHGADAMRFRALHRFLCREDREHVADAVVAVDHGHRSGIHDELRFRHRVHHLVAHAVEVPAEAQHAVRLVAP